MALGRLEEQQTDAQVAGIFSLLSDEELVQLTIAAGREMDFERYLLPNEREELHALKRELLSRLRRGNPR